MFAAVNNKNQYKLSIANNEFLVLNTRKRVNVEYLKASHNLPNFIQVQKQIERIFLFRFIPDISYLDRNAWRKKKELKVIYGLEYQASY